MEHITSKDNAKVRNFSKLMSDKKYRNQTGLFICEGEKVLYEAIKLGAKIETIMINEDFVSKINLEKFNVVCVKNHIMDKLSDTKTPQGVIFSCYMDKTNYDLSKFEKIIILDGISDPGNMGTIIRTAVAFNIDCIVLLNNSVDHYSPKVVRSTMSGVFSIPIIKMNTLDCFNQIKVPIYATYLDESSKNISDVNLEKCAVVIGNESQGVSKQVIELVFEKIIIPINNIESLNASIASSIVMWEMSK